MTRTNGASEALGDLQGLGDVQLPRRDGQGAKIVFGARLKPPAELVSLRIQRVFDALLQGCPVR